MSADLSSAQLQIRTYRERRAVVVRLEGELDLQSVAEVRDKLDAAITRSDRVVVDLSAVEFVDSTGLGVLVRATLTAQANECELRLRRPGSQVRRLLQVSGTLDAFVIEG